MGFLEDIAKNITLKAIAEMSKDENGKVDPYKAAGIAAGTGNFSSSKDKAMLGAILGSEGTFDDNDDYNTSYNTGNSHAWRNEYEFDDITSDISPYYYETEEEYQEAKYEWRQFCDYDYEHGIDPEDYETEEEYNEALNEAKYGWRDLCADGSDYGLDPEDYETEDEYNEAISEISANGITIPVNITLTCSDDSEEINQDDYPNIRTYEAAYRKKYTTDEEDIKRCDFILQHCNDIAAAKYLTDNGSFLYTQAVKENFNLPIDFPNEDDVRETSFEDMLKHLYNVDKTLTLKVWDWCTEVFLPYSEYDEYCKYTLTFNSLYRIFVFSDTFKPELIKYISEHNTFGKHLMSAMEDSSDEFGGIIAQSIKMGMIDVAKSLIQSLIQNITLPSIKFIENISYIIDSCANHEELETMETFRDNIYPIILQSDIKGVAAYQEHWDREIKNYILRAEMRCPQYAYTRRYAWRAKYKDWEDCPLSPENYESEATFLSKVKEKKVEWRRSFFRTDNHGVNPNDYENLEDFREAVDKAILAEREELKNDTTIYTYVGVVFDDSKVYNYRTTDSTIKIGDTVVVPVGIKKSNKNATVVSVGEYTRLAAPYPVEKTKEIIGKADAITDDESGAWIPYQGKKDKTSLIKSEEYKEQTRISIYSPGEFAPYEIICGIYGEMFHTVFGNTVEETTEKYEGMKIDLQRYIDSGKQDDDFCSNFTDKW